MGGFTDGNRLSPQSSVLSNQLTAIAFAAIAAVGAAAGQTPNPAPGSCTTCATSVDLGCFPLASNDTHTGCSGGSITINASDTVSINVSVDACGARVQVGGSRSVGRSTSVITKPCHDCYAIVCFPAGTVTVQTCMVKVVDDADCDMVMCNAYRCRILAYHWEPRTTTRTSWGYMRLDTHCDDISCWCHDHGHAECPCPSEAGQTLPEILPGYGPNGDSSLTIAVDQFADGGPKYDGASLNSYDDLTLLQLSNIREVVRNSVSTQDLSTDDTEVCMAWMDGRMECTSFTEWSTMVDAEVTERVLGLKGLDLNKDGVVGPDDLLIVIEAKVAADSGLMWLSSADVDGDGIVSGEDICKIVAYIEGQ